MLGGDEADDEMARAGKAVEVAGMEINVLGGEELDGQVFVWERGGDAKDGVPSAFDFQTRTGFVDA